MDFSAIFNPAPTGPTTAHAGTPVSIGLQILQAE
ncbi:hypothetical protein ABIF70_005151 [Bradyrhizobium japonicum]